MDNPRWNHILANSLLAKKGINFDLFREANPAAYELITELAAQVCNHSAPEPALKRSTRSNAGRRHTTGATQASFMSALPLYIGRLKGLSDRTAVGSKRSTAVRHVDANRKKIDLLTYFAGGDKQLIELYEGRGAIAEALFASYIEAVIRADMSPSLIKLLELTDDFLNQLVVHR
jgi:hypothetical protein